MTDQEYFEDSQKMLIQIILLEFRIECLKNNITFTEEIWFKRLEGFNVGREVLDRGFLKTFFGGGPKGINSRIRKNLIALMLQLEITHPSLKGARFDEGLKELLRIDYGLVGS